MALAEVFPSGDGEVAAGAEAESPRIVELLKERRGGKSLPFGDSQLAAVAEEMVSDRMSAATLRSYARLLVQILLPPPPSPHAVLNYRLDM